MKKKTAFLIFLCFLFAAVIGVCVMAGVSKWSQNQKQLELQEQREAYSAQLTEPFDKLYEMESGLMQHMAERRAAGSADRQIVLDAVQSLAEPIDALAAAKAPEELSEAQRHFSDAAQSFHSLSDAVTAALTDEKQDAASLRSAAVGMLPDAMDAFDQIKYGIEELQAQDAPVPESAQKLLRDLQSLMDSGVSGMLSDEQ